MSEDSPGRIADAAEDEPYPLLSLIREGGTGDLKYLGTGVGSALISQFMANADMFIIGIAFDAMFNDRAYSLPIIPESLIPTEPEGQLLFTVLVLLSAKFVDLGCGLLSQYSFLLFAQRTLHRVRVTAFDTVQRLEMDFFDTQQTGEIMSVLNNDVNALQRFLDTGPDMGTMALGMFGSSLVYMTLLNWKLALISLALTPIILGVNYWFGTRHEVRNDEVRQETGALNALLETNISGIQVVKAFGGERHETERVAERAAEQRTASWYANLVGARHQPALRLLAGMGFVATLFVGTEWVLDGQFFFLSGTLTAGELIPFAYYTRNLVLPVRFAAWVTGLYKGATSSAKRILGVQRMTASRDDGAVELEDPDGRVAYEGVNFTYPGTDERVIRDVNLDVAPGETVGFVGETGAGKSTLLKLLLDFYEPDSGLVRVDGHDVSDLSRTSLRRAIGYVEQDPFLFTGTIRENIAYSVEEKEYREAEVKAIEGKDTRPDPDPDVVGTDRVNHEDIVAAAKAANAHEFVDELDEGYDAEVGERGVKLSGGQRQRIALARVLLADPPMLVLDEATSHVDNRTEVLIQRSLEEVTAERTTFVVAHRLSTVRNADRIVVLDDGEIVEEGSHEQLLECDGKYADLWRVQVGEIGA
ncbi:ABC transporter ATP-binding protein [Halomontanus rarus]|uniref:ABC transporter ATP-binding protein n=1 Tax=Halomontanus rarus TaxID=3034020 RepID=UPI0023E887A8|nr:ABC transporter ATP-binding protein [Halovivax sp. TS33]